MRRLLAALVANVVLAWRFFRQSLWSAVALGLVLGVVIVIVLLTTTTYYVDPAGTGTDCARRAPCALATAVAQVNAGTIPGGSTIHLNRGRYGQAALTISGSGTAEQPIVWEFDDGVAGDEDDAYLSGCREAVAPSAWTLVAGTTRTYQAAFDNEGKGWTPTTAMQCADTVFAPIIVRESATSINGHTIDTPPPYQAYDTVAELEAQGGSFWFDDTNNVVYLHTYDDQAPATYHDLYLRSSGWGAVFVTGDYHTFRGIRQEFANQGGVSFRLDTASSHIIVRDGLFQSTAFNSRGDDIEISDTAFISATDQYADPLVEACYDHHADVDGFYGAGTSTGFCWNWLGDSTALSVSNGTNGLILQRIIARNNWNSVAIDHQDGESITNVQLLDSDLSGTNNHALGIHGTGIRVLRNIIDNAQESFFQNDTTGDIHEAEFAYNVFTRGVLLESARNSGVSFHHNILPILGINVDPGKYTTIDCNLYIPSVTGTDPNIMDILGGAELTSIAAVQAATPWEANGVALPYTAWQDMTQFLAYHSTPRLIGFVPDFHPVNASAQALNMPGCGRVGPYD